MALFLVGLLIGCGHHHRFAPNDHMVNIRLHRSWARHHAPVAERKPVLLGKASSSTEQDRGRSIRISSGSRGSEIEFYIILGIVLTVVTIEAFDALVLHQLQNTEAVALVHDADPPYAQQQLGWGRNTVAIPAALWQREQSPQLTVLIYGKRSGKKHFAINRSNPHLRLKRSRRSSARRSARRGGEACKK